jgi:hypothetical protein
VSGFGYDDENERDEDYWDDDPFDDDEPGEPDCWDCWNSESGWCWSCMPPPLRVRRRLTRRWRQQRRQWRKVERHANDRFWQARNRPTFDDEAPF